MNNISGWWCNFSILKNHGVRQWGWDDIPLMWNGKYISHVWNHQPGIYLHGYPHVFPHLPGEGLWIWTSSPSSASSGCSGPRLDRNYISRAPDAGEPYPTMARMRWATPRREEIESQNRCQTECQKECKNRCQKTRCQIEAQKECQNDCQIECQNICQNPMPERMSERMPERLPDRMSEQYVK